MTRYLLSVAIVICSGCANPSLETMPDIDLQGHRGARGLLPENTIPAFLKALDIGVKTLELDVAVDAEGNVIVSHEPWISAGVCSHPDGRPVTEEEQHSLKIMEMTYEQVAAFDCGSRGHTGFPEQQAMAASKPKLIDLIRAVNTHIIQHGIPAPVYNVEIKSSEEGDGLYNPEVAEFVQIVHLLLSENDLLNHATIQSFDSRALEAMHSLDPDIRIGWLVGNDDGFESNMARLSFVPDIYTPNHNLVDALLVAQVHEAGMLLVPWTVNETDRMRELIEMGVDGIITDYPDRGRNLLNKLSN